MLKLIMGGCLIGGVIGKFGGSAEAGIALGLGISLIILDLRGSFSLKKQVNPSATVETLSKRKR